MAQLLLHPLLCFESVLVGLRALLRCAWPAGAGAMAAGRPAQAVIPTIFSMPSTSGSDTVATQRANMGVAILSSQYAQQPRGPKHQQLQGVRTGVAQGAGLQPIFKQATDLQELGKKSQLAHRGGLALTVPLNFKHAPQRLHTSWRIDYFPYCSMVSWQAYLSSLQNFLHPFGGPNYVATRMQSTFVAVDEGLTEENRLIGARTMCRRCATR